MKTAVINCWNRIDIMDVPRPVPEQDEALVRILYCGICGSDIHVYRGEHPVLRPPIPLGHEMVGVVEYVNSSLPGAPVPGERVVLHNESCGKCDLCLNGAANLCRRVGVKPQKTAGDSEYMTAHIANLIRVPDGISDQAAALLEPFACAVRSTKRARIQPGDTVFVIGGGTIGLASALTARELGAGKVILSVRRESRIKLAKAFGFDTIDSDQEDVVKRVLEMTEGKGADVVIEASCSPSGVRITTDVAALEGTVVMLAVGMEPKPTYDVGAIALKELTIVGSRAHTTTDMRQAAHLIERLNRSIKLDDMISDVIPLNQIENGFKMMINKTNAGKILVQMTSSCSGNTSLHSTLSERKNHSESV